MDLNIKIQWRDSFYICGYQVETCLQTCEEDLDKLWSNFELKREELFQIYGFKNDLYGLMWYTENHQYCYLIGIAIENVGRVPEGAISKYLPGTNFAVYNVSPDISAVDAWTKYFGEVLPEADYIPDAEHGLYFEYYPDRKDGKYELWTPVVKSE